MRRALGMSVVLALAAAGVQAEVFTVGAGGTHATIQSALDAALSTAGPNEVHIAAGTFLGRIRIDTDSPVELHVSGGWDTTFSERTGETTLDAGDLPSCTATDDPLACAVLTVRRTTGLVEIDGVTIVGRALSGAYFDLSGGAEGRLIGSVLRDCRPPEGPGGLWPSVVPMGAGLGVRVTGGRWVLSKSRIVSNGYSTVRPGAARMYAYNDALHPTSVEIADSEFTGNQGGQAALLVMVLREPPMPTSVQLHGNVFRENRGGTAVSLFRGGSSFVDRSFDTWSNVLDNNDVALQLYISEDFDYFSGDQIRVSDTQVTRGSACGVMWYSELAVGQAQFTNVTIADNAFCGLRVASTYGSGLEHVHLANSIIDGNGTKNVIGELDAEHTNLIGVAPSFVDRAAGDYRLTEYSLALDAGEDDPPGGLGSTDVRGQDRIVGTHVDLGAYEGAGKREFSRPCRLGDLFGHETGVCRCTSDEGLRETRCSGELPGLSLSLRLPEVWEPWIPALGDWTLLPSAPVAGEYGLKITAQVDGEWQQQDWPGPVAPVLKPGLAVVEPFKVRLGTTEPTLLRTAFSFQRNGVPDGAIVEMLMGPWPPEK